jgi:hypothetical protein
VDALSTYPREELVRRCGNNGMNILNFHKLLGALGISCEVKP